MAAETEVLFNESDSASCLANLASCVEDVMIQKTSVDSYELNGEQSGLLYDSMVLYLEALRNAVTSLHNVMDKYSTFIGNVVDGYKEIESNISGGNAC